MIKLIKHTFAHERTTKKLLCDYLKKAEQLSMSKNCQEFEEKFSTWQGRKYSVLMNSGSSANLAVFTSLKNMGILSEQDKVGFSSLTWPTNVMPILQHNFTAIPVDVDIGCFNVTSKLLEDRLEQTDMKAMFLTNLLGFCGDISTVEKLCKRKNILLLEDNCEALGSVIDKRKLGNFSFASTFSFFVGHHLSTIEGGMVCTDDKDMYDMLKMVRAHGWSRNVDAEKGKELQTKFGVSDFYNKFTFYCNAYNFRPTEITGFLGLEQMKYIDGMNSLRQEHYRIFEHFARDNPEIILQQTNHIDIVSNFAYPLVFKTKDLFEQYLEKFTKAEVEVRPIVGGNMLQQPFFAPYAKDYSCKNATIIANNGLYFPNNPDLNFEEIKTIIRVLKNGKRK